MTPLQGIALDQRGEVTRVEELGGGMVELTAVLPHLAAVAQPGQFAQLRCGVGAVPLLRRPFSVAWTEDGCASFVFARVGVGTRLLAALRPGDPLDALGPLGTGFRVDAAVHGRHALCVSGGLGCAPFPLLIRELRAAGVTQVTVLNGAASASRLYPAERFRRGDAGVDVIELTADGSSGRAGLVTDAVGTHCDATTAVFACGPNAMMAALYRTLAGDVRSAATQVSMEAPMGCGYGTCLGCALPVRDTGGDPAWALCCRLGPVMAIEAVDWERLMELPPAGVA